MRNKEVGASTVVGLTEGSNSSEDQLALGWLDGIIFAGSLIASAVIGIFFAYRDRNKKTTENYLFGNRKMSPYAVSLSMAISYISAITVVVFPVETYLYGNVFLWSSISSFFSVVIAVVYFIPLIYRLRFESIFEYLEYRYNRTIRTVCSLVVNLHFIMYMGIAVYLPSLALNSVTPLSLEASMIITAALCTFYTTMGGIKAVVWTDALQAFFMVGGVMAVFFRIVSVVGGFSNLAAAVERGGRNNFMKFTVDPRERNSVFTYIFGFTVYLTANLATSQVQSQRYLSCDSLKNAKKAVIIKYFVGSACVTISMAIGLGMYAYLEGCDSFASGKIQRQDQAVPTMVVEIFKDISGLTGLYISAAYSGTLSTVSSGINSIAAVVLNDYIGVLKPKMPLRTRFMISRVLSAVIGCIVLVLALIVSKSNDTISSLVFIMDGCASGPILGVFVLAAFVPLSNNKGALAGLLAGVSMSIWIGAGSLIYGGKSEFRQTLPVLVNACGNMNSSTTVAQTISSHIHTTTMADVNDERPLIADTLYSVSPYYVGTAGFLSTLIIGILVSLLTGRTKSRDINPKTFIPLVDNKRLPKCVRQFFRFGVPEMTYHVTEAEYCMDEVKT